MVIEPQELTDERGRLRNLNSLTIIAYIKTKFEDFVQNRLEEEKDPQIGGRKGGGAGGVAGAMSEVSSTFHSLDAPEEYESQLQEYEAEVRNHIKVEQQLKLHIEVLQEKIDDLEREKKEWEAQAAKDSAALEKKLKLSFQKHLDQKQAEVTKL